MTLVIEGWAFLKKMTDSDLVSAYIASGFRRRVVCDSVMTYSYLGADDLLLSCCGYPFPW